MLDIKVTVSGEKIVIEGLQSLAKGLPKAVDRGLSRIAKGVHRNAFEFLSGAGSKGLSREVTSKTGKKYLKWEKRTSPVSSGGILYQSEPAICADGSITHKIAKWRGYTRTKAVR